MSRNALFAGKNVCMPHAPSVGAGIPWVAHPISKCDTCTLFDHHTSGLHNKDTCHNVTIPPASSCCIPGLPSCNLTSATPIMTDLLMPRMFYWCMENHAPASTTLGEIPRERCSFVIERRTEFDVYVTTSDTKEENELKECLYGNPSLPKLFAINQWCMMLLGRGGVAAIREGAEESAPFASGPEPAAIRQVGGGAGNGGLAAGCPRLEEPSPAARRRKGHRAVHQRGPVPSHGTASEPLSWLRTERQCVREPDRDFFFPLSPLSSLSLLILPSPFSRLVCPYPQVRRGRPDGLPLGEGGGGE